MISGRLSQKAAGRCRNSDLNQELQLRYPLAGPQATDVRLAIRALAHPLAMIAAQPVSCSGESVSPKSHHPKQTTARGSK